MSNDLEYTLERLDIRALDLTSTRVIYFRTKRGEMYLPLEEARVIAERLASALERATDPTPIPAVVRTYSAPPPKKVQVTSTITLADLGLS